MPRTAARLNLFIDVSRRPKDMGRMERFLIHLDPVRRSLPQLDVYHRYQVQPGQQEIEILDGFIQRASLRVLLISPSYLAEASVDRRIRVAVDERIACPVFPILIDDVILPDELRCLQCLPRDGVPISRQRHQDRAWKEAAELVVQFIQRISGIKGVCG